jgi:Zn-dependent protease
LPDINFAHVFLSLVVLLFSLTVHETAHAWTADRLGDPTARLLGRVSLNPVVHVDPIGTILFPLLASISGVPLIGWAKPVPVVVSRLRRQRRDYVLVAAAGPGSNLLLALASAIVLRLIPVTPATIGEPNLSVPLATLLGRAMQINVLLAVFNMIPIPPLDGGNVIGGLLPRRFAVGFDSVRPYGFLVIYALMFTGALENLVAAPYRLLISWLL